MGYPDISFAGKAAKFAMSTLATAVIITASSAIAHGKEAVKSDKRNIVPPYAARDNNTVCTGCKSRNKPINIRDNRNLQDLSVSKEFKYYKQMDSLDLADPEQADTFLRFMDIRLAEKELNEEVLLVSHNKPVMKDPEKIDKPKRVDKKKAERISSLKERQKDRGKTIASKGPVERKGVDKEKEQARMARVMERRKAREQAKAEERRKAEEKANPGKQKAEELNLAEAEQKHKADEKAKTEQKKAEAQALEKKSKEKKQEHTSKDSGKKCPLEEKKKEEAARLARKQEEQK
nr:hypothetical protein [Endozoicomonas sp.]